MENVYLIIDTKSMIIYGCFADKDKAYKFIDKSTNTLTVKKLEIQY